MRTYHVTEEFKVNDSRRLLQRLGHHNVQQHFGGEECANAVAKHVGPSVVKRPPRPPDKVYNLSGANDQV